MADSHGGSVSTLIADGWVGERTRGRGKRGKDNECWQKAAEATVCVRDPQSLDGTLY